MNKRTTAIGVFKHPLIQAIIKNDIAKISEVNRLIVEEVMAEAPVRNPSLFNAVAGLLRDIGDVRDGNNTAENFLEKYNDENRWYGGFSQFEEKDQKSFRSAVDYAVRRLGSKDPIKSADHAYKILRDSLKKLGDEMEFEANKQDPLQAVRDVLDTFKTVEDYEARRVSELKPIVDSLEQGQKGPARRLITQKVKALEAAEAEQQQAAPAEAPPAAPEPAPEEEPAQQEPPEPAQEEIEQAGEQVAQAVQGTVDSAEEAPQQIAAVVDDKLDNQSEETKEAVKDAAEKAFQKVAAAKTPDVEEVVTDNDQLEELFRAYSDFESDFMDVPTLREQGNLLAALIQALSGFEKASVERAAIGEAKDSDVEEIDVETKVDLRKSVNGIKDSMFRVLKVLKQYKRKMFDLDSGDVKKVVVSALNDIQQELKRAYEALQDELGQERVAQHSINLKEQVTDESISQVRRAYNSILSAISEFYNEAEKGRYKVSFRDSTFAKAREAIKDIQDYFPQVSPFSTGQSIDEITPQLSKVFMKLRPVMDEFIALSKEDDVRRDAIKKFMERIKDVSLEINNLFGVETEIPEAEEELEDQPSLFQAIVSDPEGMFDDEPEDEDMRPLQEQILKLITPIVREQIRGGNG